MEQEKIRANCPKCGCFLQCVEYSLCYESYDDLEWYYKCNNKKCDWKEPAPKN